MPRPYVPRGWLLPSGVYALACGALWPWPVFGVLHAESSAVLAGVAFFTAGTAAVRIFRHLRAEALRVVLARHLLLTAVPLALMSASLLWRPNCGYLQGLVLFVAFVPPSAALGVALGWALTGLDRGLPTFWVVGLGVGLLPVLYDLGLHPQFYTYNHVWGGVLGPIYDEELAVRPGVFAFRALTGLWTAWLVVVGMRLRTRTRTRGLTVAGALLALGLGGVYLAAVPLGINTTDQSLQRALPDRVEAGVFRIHHLAAATSPREVGRIADRLVYAHAVQAAALGLEPDEPVDVYLYADEAVKAALTGARRTNVAPVWLPRPQIHLLLEGAEASAEHEVAHILARSFGGPAGASLAVGLVEGLAVALAPPDGWPEPHDLVAASERVEAETTGALPDRLAARVEAALSPWGFWTARGEVAYATTGSFARWLLDEYGPASFAEVYRTADFEAAYGQPLSALTAAWAGFVRGRPVTAESRAFVTDLFTRPSLFERRCPHHVPGFVRATRAAHDAFEADDPERALALYDSALRGDSLFAPALEGYARAALGLSQPGKAASRLAPALADTLGDRALLWARWAAAQRILGDSLQAEVGFSEALEQVPRYAPRHRAVLQLQSRLHPAAVLDLLAPGAPEGRARALESHAARSPEAAVFAAFAWRDAERPRRALRALLRYPPRRDERAVFQRWAATLAYEVGDLDTAVRAARGAEAGFAAADQQAAAREAGRFAERLTWLAGAPTRWSPE